MNTPDPHSRYLVLVAILLASLMLLAASINIVVDPYGVYGTVSIPGLNAKKVRAAQEGELFKSVGVTRVRARTLVLGNSRAEIGFDPQSAAWPQSARPVYNLALPGTGPSSAADMLSRAAGAHVPERVVLALDFPDFLRMPADPIYQVAELLPTTYRPSFEAYVRTTLTLDSLWNSVRTIAAQRDESSTALTAQGFNPLRDYDALVRSEGHRSLFRQKATEYETRLRAGGRDTFVPGRASSPEYEQVRAVLAFCRARGIEVRVVVYPYHAQYMELLDGTGLWSAFEQWKLELVRLAMESTSAGGDVQVWDFSGYSAFTTEPVPREGDRHTQMKWYWELGHFKSSLGDAIVVDLYGSSASWGRRLERGADAALAAIRVERATYRSAASAARARLSDAPGARDAQ